MGDSDCQFSLSSLLCRENETFLGDGKVDEDSFDQNNYMFSENDKEYIEMLIRRENSLVYKTHESCCPIVLDNWLKSFRLDAILWILKTRAFFGFSFQTAFLSITYFDRFLSKQTLEIGRPWAISLLSVACLSLAAKMEEYRVPALSEFPVEEFNFKPSVIQRMELLVLNTLEWRMGLITPFTYIRYFITKFSGDPQPRDLVSKTGELILGIMREMSLIDHRPSVIAAAAVLAATNQSLTRKTMEFKMSVLSSCGFLQNDHVYSCYNLIQESELRKLKIPKFIISPHLSPSYSSSINVVDNSSFPSADSSFTQLKRRRLRFDDCSQNSGGMSNEKDLL